jgi:hypothetical protein
MHLEDHNLGADSHENLKMLLTISYNGAKDTLSFAWIRATRQYVCGYVCYDAWYEGHKEKAVDWKRSSSHYVGYIMKRVSFMITWAEE